METNIEHASATATELEDARRRLGASRDRLIALCAGSSESCWTAKPVEGSWSTADHIEHLALLEELFNARLAPKLLASSPPGADRNLAAADARVLEWDDAARSTLGVAPAPLQPSGRCHGAESLRRFVDARAATIAFLDGGHNLRAHAVEHPVAGMMDAYQWLLFVAAHTDRHVRQIQRARTGSAM